VKYRFSDVKKVEEGHFPAEIDGKQENYTHLVTFRDGHAVLSLSIWEAIHEMNRGVASAAICMRGCAKTRRSDPNA